MPYYKQNPITGERGTYEVGGGIDPKLNALLAGGTKRDIPTSIIQDYFAGKISSEEAIAQIQGTPTYDPSKGPVIDTGPKTAPPAPAAKSASPSGTGGGPLSPQQYKEFQGRIDVMKEKALKIKAEIEKLQKKEGGEGKGGGDVKSSDAMTAKNNVASDTSAPPPEGTPPASQPNYASFYPPNIPEESKSSLNALIDKITNSLTDFENSQKNYASFAQQYSDLMQSKDGMGMSVADYENMIVGLQAAEVANPAQIASEIAGKGFATSAQIAALSNRANAVLDVQIQKYENLLTNRQNYINSYMNLVEKDRTAATQSAERMISISETLARFSETINQNNFNNFTKYQTLSERVENTARQEIATMYSVGASPTQDQWTAAGFSGSPPLARQWGNVYVDENGDTVQMNENNGAIKVIKKAKNPVDKYDTDFKRYIKEAHQGLQGIRNARENIIKLLELSNPDIDESKIVNQVMAALPDNWEKSFPKLMAEVDKETKARHDKILSQVKGYPKQTHKKSNFFDNDTFEVLDPSTGTVYSYTNIDDANYYQSEFTNQALNQSTPTNSSTAPIANSSNVGFH